MLSLKIKHSRSVVLYVFRAQAETAAFNQIAQLVYFHLVVTTQQKLIAQEPQYYAISF